jgi:hypothetical protein
LQAGRNYNQTAFRNDYYHSIQNPLPSTLLIILLLVLYGWEILFTILKEHKLEAFKKRVLGIL